MTVKKYTYKEFKEWAVARGFIQDEDIHDLFSKDGIEIGLKSNGSIFHGPKAFPFYRKDTASLEYLEEILKDHFCMQLQ